jgi:hypothetical protein
MTLCWYIISGVKPSPPRIAAAWLSVALASNSGAYSILLTAFQIAFTTVVLLKPGELLSFSISLKQKMIKYYQWQCLLALHIKYECD